MVLSRPSTGHFLFCKYFTIQSDRILPILHRNNKLNGATHKEIYWNFKKKPPFRSTSQCAKEKEEQSRAKLSEHGRKDQGCCRCPPQKAGRQLLFVPLYIGWKSAFDFCAAPRACCCWAPTSAGGSRRAIRCSGGAVGFILAQRPPRSS